jgi:hypothetical protein
MCQSWVERLGRAVGLDNTPDTLRRLQTDKSRIKIMVAPGK